MSFLLSITEAFEKLAWKPAKKGFEVIGKTVVKKRRPFSQGFVQESVRASKGTRSAGAMKQTTDRITAPGDAAKRLSQTNPGLYNRLYGGG